MPETQTTVVTLVITCTREITHDEQSDPCEAAESFVRHRLETDGYEVMGVHASEPTAPLFISQCANKTARHLAQSTLVDDPYHRAIQAAAKRLVEEDGPAVPYGSYRYLTQWESHSTAWQAPGANGHKVVVSPDGEIRD